MSVLEKSFKDAHVFFPAYAAGFSEYGVLRKSGNLNFSWFFHAVPVFSVFLGAGILLKSGESSTGTEKLSGMEAGRCRTEKLFMRIGLGQHQADPACILYHSGGVTTGTGKPDSGERPVPDSVYQGVSRSGQQNPEWMRQPFAATGPVCKKTKLPLFNPVFHLSTSAMPRIEMLCTIG